MEAQLKRTTIRVAAGILAGVILIWLMTVLRSVTTILMVTFIVAYLLDPPVRRLASWGLGRPLSALLMLIIGFSVILALLLVIIPKAFEEISAFSAKVPHYMSGLQGLVVQAADSLGITLPRDWPDFLNLIAERGKQYLPRMAEITSRVISIFFKSTIQIISTIFFILLIPVITYYLLVSFDRIKKGIVDLIPPYVREPVVAKLREIDLVISGFVRGQLTIALILGLLYTLGFLLIGIDLPVVLGVISGILWIVPYVGTLFGLISGSLMALAKYGDLLHVLYIIGWIAAVQLVEGYFLTPRIVGHAVGLHPVVYIMALIVGANLFGFAGLLVAIPVTAALKVLLMTGIAAYRRSYLYNDNVTERSGE
ncbi:MAG TPA: AI-2E family transporter [Desulfomonilaceae bacterium]|nr:AI-2E family transporter [Desulfomonilaceae bacterium]